jgi:hypothetical protein
VIDEGGALFAKRAVYGRKDEADPDGAVIRIVGDARFPKVAVYRGRYNPGDAWARWDSSGSRSTALASIPTACGHFLSLLTRQTWAYRTQNWSEVIASG